jgi:hypothetical protein
MTDIWPTYISSPQLFIDFVISSTIDLLTSLFLDRMSVGQMSVGQTSVGQMSVGQIEYLSFRKKILLISKINIIEMGHLTEGRGGVLQQV